MRDGPIDDHVTAILKNCSHYCELSNGLLQARRRICCPVGMKMPRMYARLIDDYRLVVSYNFNNICWLGNKKNAFVTTATDK